MQSELHSCHWLCSEAGNPLAVYMMSSARIQWILRLNVTVKDDDDSPSLCTTCFIWKKIVFQWLNMVSDGCKQSDSSHQWFVCCAWVDAFKIRINRKLGRCSLWRCSLNFTTHLQMMYCWSEQNAPVKDDDDSVKRWWDDGGKTWFVSWHVHGSSTGR